MFFFPVSTVVLIAAAGPAFSGNARSIQKLPGRAQPAHWLFGRLEPSLTAATDFHWDGGK
jgi:hypothetical protein